MTDIRVGLVSVADVSFHPHNVRTDLGDLRSLADSIRRYGVLQPIVVERRGQGLRLRAGHRRLAAARLAGVTRVPAVIHPEALADREWLEQSVQENVMRAEMDEADRRRTILALRKLGCSWEGVGEAFGMSAAKVRRLVTEDAADQQDESARIKLTEAAHARQRAVTRLIEAHPDDWERIAAEEGFRTPAWKVAEARRLIAAGLNRTTIAKQLGYRNPDSLAKACYQAGAADLVAYFQRSETTAERKPCKTERNASEARALLDAGEGAGQVADRLGYATPRAFARSLHRIGEHKLARIFSREAA